ncbi:MAG: family intrarane metalloprotease protein [Steroidobacteraceae bacterium]|nr:family intrarane metalloprotease protein [Steroidobacteraceae bacterium]
MTRGGAAPLLTSTLLMVRLRLRRLANQFDSLAARKKNPGEKRRTGNTGKKTSKVILYLSWPLMLFAFGGLAVQSLRNLHSALDPPDTFWLTVAFSSELVVGVAFLLLMFWLSSLMVVVASGELAKSDWDLEWLITLPIRSETLLWARILERSLVQPMGVLQLYTACLVIAWFSGFRWLAPVVAVFTAWPLLMLGAVVRTLIDTGLRLSMRPAQLRNLHAVVSVVSIVLLYLAFSLGLPGKADFMLGLAKSMPDWLRHTPMGLAVRALNERDVMAQLLYYLALLAEVGALSWAGVRLLRHQLRNGVVSDSARDASRGAWEAGEAQAPAHRRGLINLTAVQSREITLLSRDRNFLVQSLVLPLLIVGAQVLLGSSSMAADMWVNPNVLASVAFGLAAYSLSMSAFQTLNTEGHALWLLYTFPCSIESVLKDKAKLWGVMTLAYPLALFAIGAALVPSLDWKFLGAMLTALLGIPIYAFIAVALGVFGSNPLEQQQHQKVKPAYVYLYMMLAGLYIYAVVTPNLAQRLIFMTLTLLLAFALWQKARDQLPYLLDPDASPPPRVSLSDGLIAAMVFFVLQAIVMMVAGALLDYWRVGRNTGAAVLLAFAVAGALTYLLMRSVYAKAKTQGVPRISSATNLPLLGVAAGLAAGAVALGYLYLADVMGFLGDAVNERRSFATLGWWILPVALVAAPLFEEFIFRGLIFGGLRRSFGLWPAALASAALFAIVHPAISIAPVFVLGLCAALVYERTRSLLAPMLAHAVYNAVAIAAQVWLL